MDKNFRLVLKQNDEVISTMEFSTSEYTSKTLSSIDVRGILPTIFKILNNVSSKKSFSHKYMGYNFLSYYKNLKKLYPDAVDLLASPEQREMTIKDKKIKGVEIGLVFYINNEIIFDRNVYVYNYNPLFRFSYDLHEFMSDARDMLLFEIKNSDIINIYNDHKEYLNVTTTNA